MKTIWILSFALATLTRLAAQPSFTVADKRDAAKIKETILAVVIAEGDEKTLKRLSKKPEDVAAYKAGIETFNQSLRAAVERAWTITREVKFISEEEAEKLKKEKDPAYSLLELTEVGNYQMGRSFYDVNKNSGFNSPMFVRYNSALAGKTMALTISLADHPKKEIVSSFVPVVGVSPGGTTFMVLNLQNQITDCIEKGIDDFRSLKGDVAKRRSALKNKTLLIFDPLISLPLQATINDKEVDKYYQDKYEVMTFEKADAIIAQRDPAYAYIWVIPAAATGQTGHIIYNYFVVDAADGRLLNISGRAYPYADGGFHQKSLREVMEEGE